MGEAPAVAEVQQQFGDDVTIIGVASRDDEETYLAWVNERGVDGFDHIADEDGVVWREFGVTSQPAFSFIDDDGTVDTRLGRMGVEGLTERIDALVES